MSSISLERASAQFVATRSDMASRFAPNFTNARPSVVALPAIQAPTVSATWSRNVSRSGVAPPRATRAPSCSRTVMLRGLASASDVLLDRFRHGRSELLPQLAGRSLVERKIFVQHHAVQVPCGFLRYEFFQHVPAHAFRVALERLA